MLATRTRVLATVYKTIVDSTPAWQADALARAPADPSVNSKRSMSPSIALTIPKGSLLFTKLRKPRMSKKVTAYREYFGFLSMGFLMYDIVTDRRPTLQGSCSRGRRASS